MGGLSTTSPGQTREGLSSPPSGANTDSEGGGVSLAEKTAPATESVSSTSTLTSTRTQLPSRIKRTFQRPVHERPASSARASSARAFTERPVHERPVHERTPLMYTTSNNLQ